MLKCNGVRVATMRRSCEEAFPTGWTPIDKCQTVWLVVFLSIFPQLFSSHILQESDFLLPPKQHVQQQVQKCAPILSPPFGRMMDRKLQGVQFPVQLSQLSSVLYSKTPKTGSTTLTGVLQRLSLLYPDYVVYVLETFGGSPLVEKEKVEPWCREYAAILSGATITPKVEYGMSIAYFYAKKEAIYNVAEAGESLQLGATMHRQFSPTNSSEWNSPVQLLLSLTVDFL